VKRTALLLIPVLAIAVGWQISAAAGERAVVAPAPKVIAHESEGLKTAIFAGGCFWGVEGVFSHVKGVKSAVSGYHGGTAKTARYSVVSSGRTAHAEAVKVTYDPAAIRYDQLLRIFFSVVADPTLLNRQGPDNGTQYRSALVPIGTEQARVAKAYLKQMGASGVWNEPIVTKIEQPGTFHAAEKYHQDFMAANPDHPYIVRWDAPKVAALKKLYPGIYKSTFTAH
jgi:peptide-methionine (S)-S-oxide reductase